MSDAVAPWSVGKGLSAACPLSSGGPLSGARGLSGLLPWSACGAWSGAGPWSCMATSAGRSGGPASRAVPSGTGRSGAGPSGAGPSGTGPSVAASTPASPPPVFLTVSSKKLHASPVACRSRLPTPRVTPPAPRAVTVTFARNPPSPAAPTRIQKPARPLASFAPTGSTCRRLMPAASMSTCRSTTPPGLNPVPSSTPTSSAGASPSHRSAAQPAASGSSASSRTPATRDGSDVHSFPPGFMLAIVRESGSSWPASLHLRLQRISADSG